MLIMRREMNQSILINSEKSIITTYIDHRKEHDN